MALEGEYAPSTMDWVREQVEKIDEAGTTDAVASGDTRVIVITNRGNKTGKIRKTPVIRVADGDRYAAVASLGGAPKNPVWYHNLKANPQVEVLDGDTTTAMVAREVTGEERDQWWQRAAAVFPTYDEYQAKTSRVIPVFVLEPADS